MVSMAGTGANVFPGRLDLRWHNQEWLFRVQPTRSVATARMTAYGASLPLARVPAEVSSPNQQRSLRLGGGHCPHCGHCLKLTAGFSGGGKGAIRSYH
jgi:hypothetical protein